MIGMNQIKKRLVNGILIGLGVGLVGVIITIVLANNVIKGYEEGTNENFLRDYTSEVVTLTRDVVQGETITYDMLKSTRIHNSTSPTDAVLYPDAIVGKIAKYNIAENTTAVTGMFADKLLTEDVRVQEINEIVLPIDLVVNDYVDIRIMYPSGVEYVVLAQKQVSKINGTTIWMDMSEVDRLLLNSAIVDTYLTEGTKLYAIRYSDPTTQIKLDETQMQESEKYIKDKISSELGLMGTLATAEELAELVSKYAIEYRYYIESYNKIEANYQPNSQVMSYMKANKYIVEQAKAKLDASVRQSIERNIALFESSSGEAYAGVVSGITGSINELESLRNGLISQ